MSTVAASFLVGVGAMLPRNIQPFQHFKTSFVPISVFQMFSTDSYFLFT